MPTVILVNKAGLEFPVTNVQGFIEAVYSRGALPKIGSVRDNYEALQQNGPPPVENGNSFVTLNDLKSATSPAGLAQRAASVSAVLESPDVREALAVSREASSAITEWWINPVATKLSVPYERVVSGELGDPVGGKAKVLFVERNLTGTRAPRRYEVAEVIADDHCVPALHAEAGRRFLMAYQNHNGDQLLRFKVSARNGAGSSFISAPEVTRSMGASVSYADIKKVRHLSDDFQDTFAVVYRHGTFAWAYVLVTVHQTTGAVTFGAQRTLVTAGTEQCYLSVADDYGDSQVLRLGFGYNPTAARHAICYLSWNVVTGEVANQNGTVLADTDTGTGLPIVDTALTPIVAEPATGNRRFLYTRPGPDDPAALYIDYDPASVAGSSRFKLTELYGETTIPGDAFNGLLPGATPGYATAPAAAVDLPGGFTFTWIGRLPPAARASSIAHRYDGTSTGVWWLRVDASGNIGFWVRTDAATTTNYATSGAPLAAQWGNEVGIRLVIDLAAKQARRYFSLNPRDAPPTWTEAGAAQSINASSTAIATSATLPLTVSSNSTTLTGVRAVKSVALLNAAGTEVAATDFETTWAKGDTADTDAHGVVWTLNAGATIGSTASQVVPGGTRTHDLGPAGDYFGYTYLRGAAFEVPSNSGAVLLSRNAGGTETLDRLMPDGAGGWATENLLTAPTADAKLIRPYSPVDAGPGLVLVNKVTDYSPTGFTSWASSTDLIAV